MKRNYLSLYILMLALLTTSVIAKNVTFDIPEDDPLVTFAVNKLQNTLDSSSTKSTFNRLSIKHNTQLIEQGFTLNTIKGQIVIQASDSRGMMYALLELNEQIQFGNDLSVLNISQSPSIKKRGLKFNVPLDARNPSYDDTGDAAQKNIATMWDFEFWQNYLDKMATHRYNQLTLWNPQPFTSMVKFEKYPDLSLEDVYVSEAPLNSKVDVWGEAGGVSDLVLAKLKKVKSISIDEKIIFWQRVMAHAKARGIDVHIITWAIYANGIKGKYGIDEKIDNPKTISFFREGIKQLVLTYPDLKGVGITAGERMPSDGQVENWSREKWLWQTYGLGLQDTKKINPKREVDFIHRFWYSGYQDIKKYWSDYPDHFSFSFKYLMARLYSSTQPSHLAEKVMPMLEQNPEVKTWWNLRNDDIFVYRWGDPEYARAFYKNLPMHVTEGTHMGSDGYVWAKTFSDKHIDDANKWEIDKHWYRFMLWGRLAYNFELDNTFFENQLALHFPEANASLLYKTWKAASQIVPAVNRYQFQPGDRKFAPESSSSRETFRYVNDFQVARSMPKSGVLNARAYALAIINNKDLSGKTTPLQLAEFMQSNANRALNGAEQLDNEKISAELKRTLDDIRAFAHLGLYYANKIRAAVALEFHEKIEQDEQYKRQARKAIGQALVHWDAYRKVSESNYHPQMLSRVNYLDSSALQKEVEYEQQIVERKLTYPFKIPKTHDPDNLLSITYSAKLKGEHRHNRMRVNTPDGGDFMIEVYEEDGVFINNYHNSGVGTMRWEWFQELRKGKYYLNIKWKKLNKRIEVQL